MHHVWRDLHYSMRTLVRSPTLALTIVLTVGLGLGATTAMIAVVRAVLVQPLPYPDSASLVWIYTDNPPYKFRFSVVDYRALEEDHPAFSAVAAYQTRQVTVSEGEVVERIAAKSVTGSYFPLLGQRAHAGRLFDARDAAGGEPLAVLTFGYWTRRFGAAPSVVGRSLSLDGVPHTIVGVLQPSRGPLERDVALFTAERWPTPTRKGPFTTMVLGRLRPGVAPGQAAATLQATSARLFPLWKASYQDENARWNLLDLKARVVGDVASTLYVVLAAVVCVLAIAAANAVNLLIARGLQRSQELAIRGALGASRLRLLQHVAGEAAVLTAASAIVGFAVAAGSLRLVASYGAGYLPRLGELPGPSAVAGWLAALVLLTAVTIGVVPAAQASGWQLNEALRATSRSATAGRGARRLRRGMVAAEFALATPLLAAAILFLMSLDRLSRVPIGIDTTHLLSGSISLPQARYPREADRQAFWQRLQERLRVVPGVTAAAVADSRPPTEAGNRNNFDLQDRPTPAGQSQPLCTWVAASPAFFDAVGLSLVRGRLLDERSLAEDVVVVDRAWANRFFPGEEAVGRRFRGGGCSTCAWTTVVGVVDTVKWIGLDVPDDGTVYYPFVDLASAYVVVRTAGDPGALAGAVRQAAGEIDPSLPVAAIATGDELVAHALATPRYLTVLIGMFAATAFVLALVGVYGVMSYFVQQQRREIGIRLALGGSPRQVRAMVVLESARVVAVGVAVGTLAALAAGRTLGAVLYGVSASDPRGVLAVPVALLVAALAACALPARRAASVDPAEILRES